MVTKSGLYRLIPVRMRRECFFGQGDGGKSNPPRRFFEKIFYLPAISLSITRADEFQHP
jgi:hypothetical protein